MIVSRLLPLVLLLRVSFGCVFCKGADLFIKARFDKLCKDYREATGRRYCTRHPGPYSFNKFGLDEESLLFITKKTHRVFRIFEINRDSLSIAAYWDWLHEVKLLEYTKQTLCPPICEKTTKLYNCTLCLQKKMNCWSFRTCYPDTPKLKNSLYFVAICSSVCIILGLFSFSIEYLKLMKSQPAAPDVPPKL